MKKITLFLALVFMPLPLFAAEDSITIDGKDLRPGQVRVSHSLAVLKNAQVEGGLYKGDANLVVVKVTSETSSPYYLLTDGHHHALSAVLNGATKFRVHCTGEISQKELQAKMEQDHDNFSHKMTVHLWSMAGAWKPLLPSMAAFGRDAEDDLFRYFLGVTNQQFKYGKDGTLTLVDSPGEGIMFWKKVKGHPDASESGLKKAPSFAEFILASLLRTMGFSEDADPLKNQDVTLAQALIEKGRALLNSGAPHEFSGQFPFNWLGKYDLNWVYFLEGHVLKESHKRRRRF